MSKATDMPAYTTLIKPSSCELVIQRSRFIGECFPVSSETEALALLEKARKDTWDASHHCYAYSIGPKGEYARFSDDGEPSGTAGMPMMETLKHSGVTDVLCIVTRYFGGILLGTGGLARAYSAACRDALQAAETVRMAPGVAYSFRVPYDKWSLFQRVAAAYAVTDGTEYAEEVLCLVHVKTEREAAFLQELTERSNARLSGERLECRYYSFKDEA